MILWAPLLCYAAGILLARTDLLLFLLLPGLGLARLNRALVCLPIFLLAGSGWAAWRTPHPGPADISRLAPCRTCIVAGRIVAEPVRKAQSVQITIAAEAVAGQTATGKLLVQVPLTAWQPVEYGDRIRVTGWLQAPAGAMNFGAFSYAVYLARQGIFAHLMARQVELVAPAPHPSLWGAVIRCKARLLRPLASVLPEPEAALVASLALGAQSVTLAPATREKFRQLGLQHVLAASGFQVGLCAFLCLGLTRRCPRWLRVAVLLPVLAGYMLLTGLPASILRAGLAVALAALAMACFRELDGKVALAVPAWILLLWDPLMLHDLGFQFSMLATLGLMLSARPLARRLTWLPLPVAGLVSVPLAAQAWVLPLQLYHFGEVSWLFLPANLIASLFVSLLTCLGLACILLGLVCAPLLPYLAWVVQGLLAVWLGSLDMLLRLPSPLLYVPPPSVWVVVLAYASLWLALAQLPRSLVLGMLMLTGAAYAGERQLQNQCPLRVTWLYVGQGDAILIEGGGKVMLVDAGPAYPGTGRKDAGEQYILPFLRRKGIGRLDKVILSHPHLDHYGGLFSLVSAMPVGALWGTYSPADSPEYERFLKEILRQRIPFEPVVPGQSYRLGEADLEILAPREPNREEAFDAINDHSVVVRLRYGKTRLLLTGDIEEEGERQLVARYGPDLAADVVKAPHHGSRGSSTWPFLFQARPQVAIVSAGQSNRFRHPHGEALERYRALKVDVFRTDQDGAVSLCCRGEGFEVETALSRVRKAYENDTLSRRLEHVGFTELRELPVY